MTAPPRPIGYWLKRLDVLIEDHFVQALAIDEVDRRQWQVLNTLAVAPATREQLQAAVAPFLANDPDGASRAIAALLRRGWAEERSGRIVTTAEGAAAHQRLQRRVAESRRRILDGISPDQYQTVLTTLERMAANLGETRGEPTRPMTTEVPAQAARPLLASEGAQAPSWEQ